jgi:hypothetical protein
MTTIHTTADGLDGTFDTHDQAHDYVTAQET